MKQLSIIAIAIFFTAFCFHAEAQETQPYIKTVNPQTFKKLVDAGKGIILDVRTPQEISEGYINNASIINFYDDNFVEKINLIPKDKEIYVYCKSGGRSSQAAEILKKNGFNRIYDLEGGFIQWENNKFPITKSKFAKDDKIQQISLKDFNVLLNSNKLILVDFHTFWCAPCRKMAPIVDKIEIDYKDKALVMRVDVDKSKEVGKAYNVAGVPVFILYKNGKEVWKHNGLIAEEEIKKQIEQNL
ncbi:thioredoxin domain-containing protein [Flavobacterium sp. LS1P3]|uniref:thioredoxin domain-containing protein n=1 Tax=Flavobacterium sp. LS1P3 TaxID=3401720 RepID=UPI003AB0C9AC